MITDEQERRTALVNAVTAFPAYSLSTTVPGMKVSELAREVGADLRAAAANPRITRITVAIIYEYGDPFAPQQGAFPTEAKP